ncbi:MAG: tetratricopeptide repeat protein [Cytophagaceae bacterium]
MSRSQILILISAFVLVVLMLRLPKAILKGNKKIETAAKESNQAAESTPQESLHKKEIPVNELEAIEELRKNFFTFSEKEKKLKFADSLASLFRKNFYFDSAAKYTGEIALLNPTIANQIKAGDAYYEASSINTGSHKDSLNANARVFYNKVLSKNPDNLEAKAKLGMTFIGGNETMKGVGLLREVLEKDPTNELALFNLGVLSLQSGQNEKAVNRFTELLKVNPGHATGTFYLGLSYLQLGNKEKAGEFFRKAKLLEPDVAFQSTIDSYLKELQ